jgi:WD repeat-containing protein 35
MNFEKSDVWDVKWSQDDPTSFCYMEKNKLTIVKNIEIQDIVVSNGYIASYANLEIKSANLELIMYKPDEGKLTPTEAVLTHETRSLKDLREMMKAKVPMKEIYIVVDKINHFKTWSLLTQHALLNLDFSFAEKVLI